MKKLLTVFMILLLVAGFSYGQGKGKMAASVNGVVTIPFGDFGDAYKTGFGGTGTFMYFFTDQVAATFTAGYLTWTSKVLTDLKSTAIPVLVGGRYYFGKDKLHPYVLVKLGMYFFSTDAPTFTVGGVTFGGGTTSSSEFGAGGGVGLMYEVGNNVHIDANAQINAIFASGTTSTFAEVDLGVAFGIN